MSKLITSATMYGETENNALTFVTSGSAILDLFSMGGALRTADTKRIHKMVKNAWNENPKQTIATLLYLRDVRGGQGEKRVFREAIKYLYNMCIKVDYSFEKSELDIGINQQALMEAIVEVGSWKDIVEIFSVDEYTEFVKLTIENTKKDETNLCFKWLPSIGGSSNKDAEKLAKYLGMTPKQYRKMLSTERAKLKIVETQMCSNKWNEIDYEKLPSRAGFLHGPAFKKHDEERYSSYISAADRNDGSVKMNTGTLYPYEIVKPFISEWDYETPSNAKQLEATWKNLPNYCDGSNSLVVADTSGSMTCNDGLPMAVSCSLAIYFAEHNHGIFHNEFVTFSGRPQFYHFEDGQTLEERVRKMVDLNICDNTDLCKTFRLILKAAKDGGCLEEDMPKNVYVISDMELDQATYQGYGRDNMTNFEVIKKEYVDAGYKMPNVIFWNVNSHQNNLPVRMNEHGVALVSGCSASTFQMAISGDLDPIKFMLQTIEKPRYKDLSNKIIG